jgi:hypothetical protein
VSPVMAPLFREEDRQRTFDREGYVTLSLVDDGDVRRLQGIVEEVRSALRTDRRWEPRGFEELMYVEDRVLRRRIQADVESILAPRLADHVRDIHILVSNVFVKAPAPAKNLVPPHQDFCVVDESLGWEHVQMWMPLVDVDSTNGCLCVLPRAHRIASPYRAQGDETPFESFIDRSAMQPLELRAGEAVLFSGRTVHASNRNLSDRPRAAVACLFASVRAPLVHYHRVEPGRVEAFDLAPEDLRMLVPGRRPEVGRSKGFVDHESTRVSRADFLRLTAD